MTRDVDQALLVRLESLESTLLQPPLYEESVTMDDLLRSLGGAHEPTRAEQMYLGKVLSQRGWARHKVIRDDDPTRRRLVWRPPMAPDFRLHPLSRRILPDG